MQLTLDGADFGEIGTSRVAAFDLARDLGAEHIRLEYYSPIVRKNRSEEYRRIGRAWYAADPTRGLIAVSSRGKKAGQFKRDKQNALIIRAQ